MIYPNKALRKSFAVGVKLLVLNIQNNTAVGRETRIENSLKNEIKFSCGKKGD